MRYSIQAGVQNVLRARLESMSFKKLVAISWLCLAGPLLQGQRRAPPSYNKAPQAYKGLIVTFQGVLKKLTKKEILIQSDDYQLLTMRCSRKTKFLDQDGEIKPSDIDLESRVSVDASEDVDLKLLAVNVRVVEARKKTFNK
jgi:hypothetical protein